MNEITTLIAAAEKVTVTFAKVKQTIPLLDLTSLNSSDTDASITELCQKALRLSEKVAAVCVYPQFVKLIKQQLANSGIKICTVANFPEGSTDIEATVKTIFANAVNGADEIDVVMPYSAFLTGETSVVQTFVKVCKQACGPHITLKVILETGALVNPEQIYQASCAAIAGGADFIKTSTGKVDINATLPAAAAMLTAIKDTGGSVGFKAAGGIRTAQQALGYLYLGEQIMGNDWITPGHFRLGASSLLDDLLAFK